MSKRYINVKDIQRGVADTYLGVNGNGAVLSPNNSDEIDSAIAALNNQIDSIHDTLNSDYYVNIAPNYTFESNTTVSRAITGAYYRQIKEAVADNKMVMAAIVDGAVKTFNLIEQGRYNLRFASYTIDANGVLTDYIVLTEVQDGFPPDNVTVGYHLSYQSEYNTYPTADLTGYATEQWVENKGYLTGVPSEYVTETELNDAISNLEVGGIPYIIVKIEGGVANIVAGSVTEVTSAKTANKPCLAYVYNLDAEYGIVDSFNLCTIRTISMINAVYLSYHTEVENVHKTVRVVVAGWGEIAIGVTEYNYVTDEELNEAIAGLGGSDIPTVVITNGDANSTTPRVTGGDLDAVINAISNNEPYIAYFNNIGTKYGVNGKKYLIQAADFNAVNNTGALYYHTEIDGGNHMDVQIFFRKENDVYTVFNITRQYHYYQEQLTSGVNIKTINGNSILGSGDLVIEGGSSSGGIQSVSVNADSSPYLSATTTDNDVELSLKIGNMLYSDAGLIDAESTQEYLTENYYTRDSIDDMIGDINTILENIIG